MTILLTGSAGFIGMHVAAELLSQKKMFVGLDNFNHYYDQQLKYDRLTHLQEKFPERKIISRTMDIANFSALRDLFEEYQIQEIKDLQKRVQVLEKSLNRKNKIQ